MILLTVVSTTTSSCQNDSDNFAGENTLNKSSSPYLLEHAHNPVHWHEWGPEALALAKKENKPLIISVGYAACHWCHVMADESFSDTGVAEIMNKFFVCIKVDREERPDIDQIYMNAAQLINGRGGWPLNAFALPDGRPFYAGTYYNKKQWIQLLTQIRTLYERDKVGLEQQAVKLVNGISTQEVITSPSSDKMGFSAEDYQNTFTQWESYVDTDLGGTKNAPKFPLPVGWEYLLQYHHLTGNQQALRWVELTLNEMAKGGIYDQIGGGFARYSTDKRWFAPHFEKMLYDNGQLMSLYSHAYQLTKNPDYKRIIEQTLEFVSREMTDESGGFHSSLNADSEGEEGKFYVWTEAEVLSVLPSDYASFIISYYNVKQEGNWEKGKNILFVSEGLSSFAAKKNISQKDFEKWVDDADSLLLQARRKRIRPTTDDKILTSWNALMLSGYVDAYKALGEEKYLKTAKTNAEFLIKNMVDNQGKILRNYKNGKASIDGFLDDYALLAEALINLYEVSFDKDYLDMAVLITDYAIANFLNESKSMFYYTSASSEILVARKMEISDNVMPSSNSAMAVVLFKLGIIFENDEYSELSIRMLNAVEDKIQTGGPYYAKWAQLLALMTNEIQEIAILGKDYNQYRRQLQANYFPNAIYMGGMQENLPLLKNRLRTDKTQVFICRGKTCGLPHSTPESAIEDLVN